MKKKEEFIKRNSRKSLVVHTSSELFKQKLLTIRFNSNLRKENDEGYGGDGSIDETYYSFFRYEHYMKRKATFSVEDDAVVISMSVSLNLGRSFSELTIFALYGSTFIDFHLLRDNVDAIDNIGLKESGRPNNFSMKNEALRKRYIEQGIEDIFIFKGVSREDGSVSYLKIKFKK